MELNALYPQFTVSNLDRSSLFQVDLFGFSIEYERLDEHFLILG